MLLLGFCFALAAAGPARAEEPPPRVLILASYHHGNAWTDTIVEAIRGLIEEKAPSASVYVEYMDVERNEPREVYPYLETLYLSKYETKRPTVIIAVNDEALNFLVSRRDRLFQKVPIVFCSINALHPPRIEDPAGITGVTEDVDIRRTIELALRLHPGTKLVIAVSDFSSAARYDFERFWRAFPDFEERVRFDGFVGYSAAELEAELARLPKETVILDVAFRRDREGRVFTPAETVKLLSHDGKFPVYSLWDLYVGLGVVGGVVVSGQHQGEMAAHMALRILAGMPVGASFIGGRIPNVPMFDFEQLKRFGIPKSALPDGSVVVNQPTNFYWQYRFYIWGGTAVFAGLVSLVLILIVNILQKRRAFRALQASQTRYRAIVEDQTEFLIRFDPGFRITYANAALCQFLGMPLRKILHIDIGQFLPPRYFDQLCAMIADVSADNPLFSGEARARTADGAARWLKWTGRAIFGADGTVTEFQVVGADITAEKRTQKDLEKSREAFRDLAIHRQDVLEEERARISREIHDELGQNLTAINMGLSVLGRGKEIGASGATTRVREMRELTERTIGAVQRISQELRPTQLDDLGLLAAMEWHADKFLGPSGIKYRFEKSGSIPDRILDQDRATALFRVFQESLTNVVRHAGATEVTVRLQTQDRHIDMEISDNGVGIASGAKRSRNSLGIMGMRERVRPFRGRLSISGRTGRGTTVNVHLPLLPSETAA